MERNNNQQAFLALVRAGLWEKESQLLPCGDIDFTVIYRLAQEQSVIGLVAAGLERITDIKPPKEVSLMFVGEAIQLEQSNMAMNDFLAGLIMELRGNGVYTILVKGQGIAQCYERPLWRAAGDIDFFLSDINYEKAKKYLSKKASSIEPEGIYGQHLGMIIDQWSVELHGNLRCGMSLKMDRVLDETKNSVFFEGAVRSWINNGVQIFMPNVDCDCAFIFSHLLKHFYKGGVGLRQICDWCRLLWTYRAIINRNLLEEKLHSMGVMTAWKAFGSFAVEYLGMPKDAMPFYTPQRKWSAKAIKILSFIIDVGNFGHNRDMSYFGKKKYFVRKFISFRRRLGDFSRHFAIFPVDSLRFYPYLVYNGLRSAIRGE